MSLYQRRRLLQALEQVWQISNLIWIQVLSSGVSHRRGSDDVYVRLYLRLPNPRGKFRVVWICPINVLDVN